jgi:predicted phage terminase large subunit-like protein
MLDLEEAQRIHWAACQGKLSKFLKASWRILEPETPLLWNWHHDYICEYLEAVKQGQVTRLIINIAPRTTKSIMSTVAFPCWWWTVSPRTRFLFGSYSASLATKHSVLRRNIIESQWYQQGYGKNVQLTADTNMKTEFANTATGFMKSAGITGGVMGEGGDCIIFDDPHSPKGAESDDMREATLQSMDLMWSSRLNDKKTGRIVLIMQRLHMMDATAHLLAKNMGYEHICIPTIAETPTRIVFPVSKKIIERKEGDLLHPERDGPEQIEQAKKDLRAFGFAGQHQQRPVPREGAIVKHEWLKRRYKELPVQFEQTIQSWDLTFKGTVRSDYVVGLAIGRIKGEFYLFPKRVRGQLNFPETLTAFRGFSNTYPDIRKKLVEAKANGAALTDSLKKEIPGIVPYEPHGTKEERLSAVSPIMESGNFILPDESICPWIQEYVDEMTSFPRAPNDDYVDATTQGLDILSQRRTMDWSPVSITGTSKWR